METRSIDSAFLLRNVCQILHCRDTNTKLYIVCFCCSICNLELVSWFCLVKASQLWSHTIYRTWFMGTQKILLHLQQLPSSCSIIFWWSLWQGFWVTIKSKAIHQRKKCIIIVKTFYCRHYCVLWLIEISTMGEIPTILYVLS